MFMRLRWRHSWWSSFHKIPHILLRRRIESFHVPEGQFTLQAAVNHIQYRKYNRTWRWMGFVDEGGSCMFVFRTRCLETRFSRFAEAFYKQTGRSPVMADISFLYNVLGILHLRRGESHRAVYISWIWHLTLESGYKGSTKMAFSGLVSIPIIQGD